MATITSTAAQSTSRLLAGHIGTHVVRAQYVTDGNETADTIQLVKVPDNATVAQVMLAIPANLGSGGNPVGYAVGDGASTGRFIASATISSTAVVATINQPGGVAYKYTFSDDASVKWDTIDLVLTAGSCTSSITIAAVVTFTVNAD